MGRPLHKKYFGNRNIGSTSTIADNGIGGSAVGSADVSVAGSYTTRPTFAFSAPDVPGGTQATGSVISEVLSATISGGTGYGNAQTFDLTVNTAGGTAVLNVTSTAGGAITTVNSITTRGTFTTLGPVTSVSGGTGSGAVPVLTFRAKSVQIDEPGSGYNTAPTIASYTNRGGITINNVQLAADTGLVGSATNDENALILTAFLTGGSALAVDVIKQVSTNRYKVTDGTRTGIVQLVAKASGSLAVGEANLIATDASSNTYYVTKLTAHKALLTRTSSGSGEFASGTSVPWTMNGTSGTKVYSTLPYLATGVNVQIANG